MTVHAVQHVDEGAPYILKCDAPASVPETNYRNYRWFSYTLGKDDNIKYVTYDNRRNINSKGL